MTAANDQRFTRPDLLGLNLAQILLFRPESSPGGLEKFLKAPHQTKFKIFEL